MTKIYLDAGHGGKDSGAVGNGLYEKDVVLKISRRIRSLLEQYKNVQVLESRDKDVFLDLSERTDKANKWGADAFVSIHINAAASTSAKGFETFIYNGISDAETTALQNVMHQEIVNQIRGESGFVDRGKKRANFHVLRESRMKAILSENLFISNASDAKNLKSEAYLEKLAQGHVKGLEKFFGLEREIRPPTNPPESDGLYQVIAGTFSTRDRAEARCKKLKADGYECYVLKKE